jgi:thiamine-phosphate pyrophosphorylase
VNAVFAVLHAIVDVDVASRAGWAPRDLARAFMDGGARLIQLRAKQLASGPFLELCDDVVRLAVGYQAQVVVNDRVDLARLSGAAGVHVGQDDLAPDAARAQLGAGAIVGYSTHSVEQAQAALSMSALAMPLTYIAVGPVFGTTTKDTGYTAVGLDLVRTVAGLASATPVVAIGGVTLDNAVSAIEAGAAAVAVIGDLLATDDPAGRTRAYLQCLTDIAYSRSTAPGTEGGQRPAGETT